jgi:hypothetical protein
MKCKPNDIAVILESEFPENVGQFVTVIKLSPDEAGAWLCKPMAPGRTRNIETGEIIENDTSECSIDDVRLQPIRGDKAKTKKATKPLETVS